MTIRRHLLELLSHEPRSISSLARELGTTRGDMEADLQHASTQIVAVHRAGGHPVTAYPVHEMASAALLVNVTGTA